MGVSSYHYLISFQIYNEISQIDSKKVLKLFILCNSRKRIQGIYQADILFAVFRSLLQK